MRRRVLALLVVASIGACSSFGGTPASTDGAGDDSGTTGDTGVTLPDSSSSGDAALDAPRAKCADSMVHDFCTSFDDGSLSALWTPNFFGTGVATRSLDASPPSPPNALLTTTARATAGSGHSARHFVAVPDVRPAPAWTTASTFAFTVYVEENDDAVHGAIIASMLLGDGDGGPDRIAVGVQAGSADNTQTELTIWETQYRLGTAVFPAVKATGQVFKNGRWTKIVARITPRGAGNPGSISVSVDGGSAVVLAISSDRVNRLGQLELGLMTGTSGAHWKVRFDDVMADWAR